MSFRILNQAPQYLLRSGAVNAGGSLTFYETDLTTLKNTWSDEAMAVLNSNPVLMDSAGRSVTDVWGLGEYGVVMKDALGVVQWTRNNVRADTGDGTAFTLPDPAGQLNKFLISDNTNYVLQSFFVLPDPTGLNNYMVVSDGEGYVLQQIEEPEPPPAPDIDVTTTTCRIAQGDTSFYVQSGTGTAPNVGGRSTTIAVVYATPFVNLFGAPTITPTGSTYSSFGNQPSWTLTANSVTGFTVKFTMGELDDSQSGFDFNAAVPFGYVAFGTIATPP